MKIFVNVARLEIGQFFTFYSRRAAGASVYFGHISSFLMQILTQYVWRSVLSVISPDFECPHPKLETCHKIPSDLLQLKHVDVKFCMFVCLSYDV